MIKFEKKFLYTFIDEEEVRELIGKKGIFFDIPLSQNELESASLRVLTRFSPESPTPFEFEVKGEYGNIEGCDSTFFYYDPNLGCKRAYYLQDKPIQWRDKVLDLWTDCNGEPSWTDCKEYRIKPEPIQNDSSKEDHRSYNVGESDYSKHEYQVWDIWRDFELNPWEADIVKRLLRYKKGEENDLKKINHILTEMMSQTNNEIKKLHDLFGRIKDEYKLNSSTSDWLERFLLDKKQEELLNLNDLYLEIDKLKK